MLLTDADKGIRVRYVPYHAQGDINHKDCQDGAISSHNDRYIFVKYDNTRDTSQGTRPDDLIILR